MVLRRSLPRFRVCYITDVEGDVPYFQRFLQHKDCPLRWEKRVPPLASSRALQYTAVRAFPPPTTTTTTTRVDGLQGSHHHNNNSVSAPNSAAVVANDAHGLQYYTLGLKDAHTHFVFGGDVFDHGSDLMLGQCLLDLQARYPERVHFILGNRDINKMVMTRIADEVDALTPEEAEDRLFGLGHYPSRQPPPASYMAEIAAKKKGSSKFLNVSYAGFLQQQQQQQEHGSSTQPWKADRVTFLKWALHYRMGSQRAFESRRAELRQLRAADAPEPTDAEVASSFFEAARPGGVYAEYLAHARLACALEGTLFVHGGVTADNVGFVPDLEAPVWEQAQRGRRMAAAAASTDGAPSASPDSANTGSGSNEGVAAWLDALEAFRRASVAAWRSGDGARGEALRLYAMPKLFAPYSIVVGTFVEEDGPRLAPLPVVHYLLSDGISTVCSGHQPCGDTPLVVRQPGGFMMIDADNSYCGRGNALCSPTNHRGGALSFVCFEDDGGVWAKGARADGTPFAQLLNDPQLPIGRCVGEGWWVKCAASGEGPPQYEAHRTADGYRTEEVRTGTAEELQQLAWETAAAAPAPGELAARYTKEELAEVRVHRLKTKVRPPAKDKQAEV